MRGLGAPFVLLLVAACSSYHTAPGDAPDGPATLSSTTLDGAIALTWSDNSFLADPMNFQNYRVLSAIYDLDKDVCGPWRLEGTTVAPEFIVGALDNGVPRCFAASAVGVTGAESALSPIRSDTPRPDARNVVVYTIQGKPDSSGFRFWDDDGDGRVEDGELGRIRAGNATDIDFFVDRDGVSGLLYFNPVRAGTGVEPYNALPVNDLTSVDIAPCLGATPGQCAAYATSPIEASPGFGYVFETDGGDTFVRYGAVRVTHVGQSYLILDWAFQTDRGNADLLVQRRATSP